MAKPDYSIEEKPSYTLLIFRKTEVDREHDFNTLQEISDFISTDINKVHNSIKSAQITKLTNEIFRVRRNDARYTLKMEGEPDRYFRTIKAISAITGDYFNSIKTKII